MKYLKLFEDFNNDNFPDVFGGKLIRGVHVDKDEYIDDPKLRKISSGNSSDENYVEFINNYAKLGIPHPLKSIHMYFRPDEISTKFSRASNYGKIYDIYPKEGAIFGFNKELRNGGLGSTWFFPERTVEDFLGKNFVELFPEFAENLDMIDTEWIGSDQRDIWGELYYEDRDRFMKEITKYQQMLIDAGVIGTITYDELVKMSKEEGETLQVWTESPCYHKKRNKKPKIPKSYKNEHILTDEDFTTLGVGNKDRYRFFKKYGKEIKDSNLPISDKKRIALRILKKWVNEEL